VWVPVGKSRSFLHVRDSRSIQGQRPFFTSVLALTPTLFASHRRHNNRNHSDRRVGPGHLGPCFVHLSRVTRDLTPSSGRVNTDTSLPHKIPIPGYGVVSPTTMGDGGGDEIKQHDTVPGGISLLGTDGKRYVVDEATASYFYEIEGLITKDPETPEEVEERTVLAGNALEEAVGHEMALSMDARCSRVMEKLLAQCGDDDLFRYLGGITTGATDFHTLCKSLFGSRVAEKALGCVCARVGRTPGDALIEKVTPVLVAISDAIAATAVDSAYDPRVSPVARTHLSLLSGRECAPAAKAGGLAGKLKGGTSAAGGFGDAVDAPAERHVFEAELRRFSDLVLASLEPELWNLSEDACGSAFLQALLTAHKGDTASLNWIIPGFLGCAPEEGTADGELLANADAGDVKRLAESRSGSHLFEAILRAAPKGLMNEIFRRFFRDSMRSLASHPTANFTLQALLAATREPEHVATAMQELGSDFGSLMRERRSGVVASILAACARLRTGERDAAKNLARGLTAKGPARVQGRSQLAPALLWMDQHSGAAGGRCSVLGAAMLQTLLKFPPDAVPHFVESLASMTPAEASSAARDAGGSRALEAFLTNPAHKPKLKKELVEILREDFGKLAVSACGSHVLQACYGACDTRMREQIVQAVALDEQKVAATRHGPFLMKRLGVAGTCCISQIPTLFAHTRLTLSFIYLRVRESARDVARAHGKGGGHQGGFREDVRGRGGYGGGGGWG
jgi:nucleolar protein 9